MFYYTYVQKGPFKWWLKIKSNLASIFRNKCEMQIAHKGFHFETPDAVLCTYMRAFSREYVLSFDWSRWWEHSVIMYWPIRWHYTFAAILAHKATKMAVHPSHEYNQTSQKKQNDNKTVNVANFWSKAEDRACNCLFKGQTHEIVTWIITV